MQMNTIGTGALAWPSTKQSIATQVVAGAAKGAASAGTTATGLTATGAATGAAAAPVVKGSSAAGFADSVNTGSTGAAGTDSADGTEDRFLKLLVAQMRNQDPLNPMDNAQVTSQLAQISTVRGIEGLNRTMSDFVASSVQGSALSSVGMLGKQVLVPGSNFNHTGGSGTATRIGFELASSATAARIDVVDAQGKVVFSNTSRNLQQGLQTFEWDGRNRDGGTVAAGPLSVQVIAVDGTVAVDAQALVPARVVGISQTADGARLELDGGKPVAPADVRVIL